MHVASDDPAFYSDWHFAGHFAAAGYAVGLFGKHLNNDNPFDAPPGVDRWLVHGGGDYLDPSFSWAPAPGVAGSTATFDNCTGPCYSTSVIGNATAPRETQMVVAPSIFARLRRGRSEATGRVVAAAGYDADKSEGVAAPPRLRRGAGPAVRF